jgi:hypothetical protein
MEFIVAPLIVWICVSGVYGLFELYARRGERKAMIEKMGDKLDSSFLEGKFGMPTLSLQSFSSLKVGSLLVGLGLGLLVGLLIHLLLISNNYYEGMDGWNRREMVGMAYGASVLFFGGIGLLVSFMIEHKMNKKDS